MLSVGSASLFGQHEPGALAVCTCSKTWCFIVLNCFSTGAPPRREAHLLSLGLSLGGSRAACGVPFGPGVLLWGPFLGLSFGLGASCVIPGHSGLQSAIGLRGSLGTGGHLGAPRRPIRIADYDHEVASSSYKTLNSWLGSSSGVLGHVGPWSGQVSITLINNRYIVQTLIAHNFKLVPPRETTAHT